MAFALLIATGGAICAAVQLSVRRHRLALFLSVVATMIGWALAGMAFAFATTQPIFGAGEWNRLKAVLGAALIAQIVAIFLRRFR